ncbi:MAG: hypothetical protein AVDCRST_MAG53-1937 [uncultured Solirubrobacteraceae bacterium]|uniref:Cupin type-2 domain-containing protein n=1 Tax=uncultured Solirubrobacteraceae bacterium TaxID=1162706 RepID=A0A6J4SJ56_9ACTN|nr:MAG: hypothetical protein AVDCRST_MAG53-1937 [uncultured Solirubrobacteraceae bacterium]
MSITADRSIYFQGLATRLLFATEAQSLLEHELAPGALGSPLHTHAHEDEVSYVISGLLGVQIGDEVREARAGETVVKPRGVQHAFWNPGDEPVRFVELITPGGFEQYFADVEPIAEPPDFAALAVVAERYGLDVDPLSISVLAGEHGLNLGPCPTEAQNSPARGQ